MNTPTQTSTAPLDPRDTLHIAIIMDGNGRWATRRGMPRIAGHRAGVAAVRRVVESALDSCVACLTLYAFSSDNWRRPAPEVTGIFRLLRIFLRHESEQMRTRGVRLQVIGRRDRLDPLLLKEIERAEATTSTGRRLSLRIAIDYSSRDAMLRAAITANAAAPPGGPVSPEWLQPRLVSALCAEGDVDLLIRTGGEKRLSDFLLWESAYAELLFTDRMWPDFQEADFQAALTEFRSRGRRFGSLSVMEPPVEAASALNTFTSNIDGPPHHRIPS
jgi:undecaprenyl diphosphate synthase